MGGDFKLESKALLTALQGGRPERSWYDTNLDLDRSRSGSANHKLQCNPCEALDGLNLKQPGRVNAVLDWAEWYAEQALHENEAMTPNGAYRPAIEEGTFYLAGCAHEAGRAGLRDHLLRRSRAGISWIALGAGSGQAREIRDHHLDKIGQAVLFIGDGKRSGLSGLPYFTQAGKRGYVREGGSNNHDGPISDPQHNGIGALVGLALNLLGSVPQDWSAAYRAARARWPDLLPFGFSDNDRGILAAYLKNPLDVLLARQVFAWAEPFRPDLPFAFIHYADGSAAAICKRSDGSSTGCEQADVLFADGTHYIASADTGSRGGEASQHLNIQPQTCTETATGFECAWISGEGRKITAPKPQAAEAWRVETTKGAATFRAAGAAPGPVAPNVPPPATPPNGSIPPDFHLTSRWLTTDRAHLLVADTATPIEIVPIHPEPNHGEPQRWLVRIKKGG